MRAVVALVVFALAWNSALACIGDGCVHDRERDQFFWCSGNIGQEKDSIISWFGGLNKASYESYCTQVSAMLVTTNPDLRSVAVSPAGERKTRSKDRRTVSLSTEKILEGKV